MSRKKRVHPRKSVYLLPNLLTMASLFCGFLGLTRAIQGDFESCALLILVSCIFDGLDGKVARLTRTTSEFGVQLDSLADLVAFGVTPGLMVYLWQLQDFGRLGLMASFLFAACGALRLARFNVQAKTANKMFFLGLPIPAAACTLATWVLFTGYIPENLSSVIGPVCLGMTFCTAILMVSTARYASFKEYGFLKAHRFSVMVTALMLFALIAVKPKLIGFIVFFGYALSGPLYTIFFLSRRSERLLRSSEKELS